MSRNRSTITSALRLIPLLDLVRVCRLRSEKSAVYRRDFDDRLCFAYHVAGHPMDFRVYHYGARGVFGGTRPVYGLTSGVHFWRKHAYNLSAFFPAMQFHFFGGTMLRPILARALLFSLATTVFTIGGAAQTRELKNPVEGQPKAIERGDFVYKRRCSNCHGLDARGYRAPDLTTGQFSNGTSDAQLYRVITRGIPASEMGGTNMNEDEVWALISYLRTVVAPGANENARGNAQAGEAIYSGKARCTGCHMVSGKGGRLGPDLSRIGVARSRTALVREIRSASEYIPQGYEPVTVVMRDGRQIKGARKNEDSFSIQIMETNEQLSTFLKKDLREVIEEKKSLMPDYEAAKLTEAELDDLLAYLRTLRGR